MNNMKFRIQNPEHSEAIRKEVIRLGMDINVDFYNCKFAFVYFKTMTFGVSNDIRHFKAVNATETTLEELKAM